MSYVSELERTEPVRGRELRYLLTSLLLEAAGPMTVHELERRCAEVGVVFNCRPSKMISDELRWEVAKGRVIRRRRGVYEFGHAPRSTRSWIRGRGAETRKRMATDGVSTAVG